MVAKVVNMVLNGRSVREVSQSLGIGENLIYRRKSGAKIPSAAAEGGVVDGEALYRRIRELEVEREILKKSLAHFLPTGLRERYRFLEQWQSNYSVQGLCRAVQVSRSGFYNWLNKVKHPEQKLQQQTQMQILILHTFWEHHRRYGVRRIVAELKQQGVKATKHTAQKVLHHYGLTAIQPRSFVPRTTQSRHPYPISPNLLLDQAFPRSPNQLWVGDITYIPLTGGGFLYLAVWMDLFSRLIVGWHLEEHMQEVLVLQALKNALQHRSIPNAMIVHSDQGGQYAGKSFRRLLAAYRIRQSMSRADNVYDNAFMEALFSRFKAELLQNGVFLNKGDAYTGIFEYIEMYYNTKRRHSALGYQSPVNYENSYYNSIT